VLPAITRAAPSANRSSASQISAHVGSRAPPLHKVQPPTRHVLPRIALAGLCRFEIHREDEVMVTSTQFCGGDWRWTLCSSRGQVLAEGAGFSSERDCRAAIATLKDKAAMASVMLCG
jgi:uncharacterized protein YegP (UPF0339 family)